MECEGRVLLPGGLESRPLRKIAGTGGHTVCLVTQSETTNSTPCLAWRQLPAVMQNFPHASCMSGSNLHEHKMCGCDVLAQLVFWGCSGLLQAVDYTEIEAP